MKEAALAEVQQAGQGVVASLTEHVGVIAAVKSKAESELGCFVQELRDATKALGEAKVEVGRLEKELTYARYLTADDDTALCAAPKEIVLMFLERVSRWCKLRRISPLKVPGFISSKYHTLFSSYETVALVDLVRWIQTGLAEHEEGPSYMAVKRA